MKLSERIKISECSTCPWSSKKYEGTLMCQWDKNKPIKASSVKKCLYFPTDLLKEFV